MKQFTTVGIVLARTDFGEADRILTMLTPQYGKLRLMARGVRRVKSKLAGGIELFSVSDITFIRSRGAICTLVSSRLQKHYSHIVQDIDRTMLAYDLIKLMHRTTEDEPEAAYFHLLQAAFEMLDNPTIPSKLISVWFSAQLLRLAGHYPSLQEDDKGQRLEISKDYEFNFERMAFKLADRGLFTPNHIKFMRLLFSANSPKLLVSVQDSEVFLTDLEPIVQTMIKTYIRI
jgi:DNA repair protein RecO (recombination protein O)